MLGMTWLRGMVRRSGRLSATAVGVAIAVALLASIGTFLAGSQATMTTRAVQTVLVSTARLFDRSAACDGIAWMNRRKLTGLPFKRVLNSQS